MVGWRSRASRSKTRCPSRTHFDLEVGSAQLRPRLDVAAGAETLALAGNQHDADCVCRLGRVQRGGKRSQHRNVERVEFFRPPERDGADRAVLLERHQLFRHVPLH